MFTLFSVYDIMQEDDNSGNEVIRVSDQQTPNLSEQIKNAAQEGLASGDFSQFNSLVSESVSQALSKIDSDKIRMNVEDAISQGRDRYQKQMQHMQDSWENWNKNSQSTSFSRTPSSRNDSRNGERYVRPTNVRGQAGQPGQPGYQRQPQPTQRYVRNNNEMPRGVRSVFVPAIRKKGNALSVLGEVFGGMGIFFNFLFALILLLDGEIAGGIFFTVFLIISIAMLVASIKRHSLIGRAKRYAQMAGPRRFISIDDLVRGTQFAKKPLLKDIKKMMRIGIFPQGHMDDRENYLFLSDEVYGQYQQAENGRKAREQAQQQIVPPTPEEQKNAELEQMVREGNEAIYRLRAMNDMIEGEVISGKLSHLEALLQEIFQKVQEYPDQMSQMHTMMSYYLPTVIKLVEAYKEFDSVSAPGPDIIAAKQEIENTLDTLNSAFTELLNNLFKDRVVDITTDAQVLQTMLAREGLSKEGSIHDTEQKSAAPSFEDMLNYDTSAGPDLVLSYGVEDDNK